MSSYEWLNVKGEFFVELDLIGDTVIEISYETGKVPGINADMVSNTESAYELVIEFLSSGFYDEGRTHGDPGNCYPPDGDEDRELSRAYILEYKKGYEAKQTALSPEKSKILFDHFEALIDEVELPDMEEDY